MLQHILRRALPRASLQAGQIGSRRCVTTQASFLGNYHVIVGDEDKKIEHGKEAFKQDFEIEGRDKGGGKILMFMVKGLGGDDCGPVNIDINGIRVGQIFPTPGTHPELWSTQIVHYAQDEGKLRPNWEDDGLINTIKIPGELRPGDEANGGNNFTHFFIRNLTMFYRQAV